MISVNSDYAYAKTDFIFASNLRRFKELDAVNKGMCIVTSNIPADGVYFQTNYKDLVNSIEAVSDNAGLMAIRFLMQYAVTEIKLAGFDGYSHDAKENYADISMELITRNAVLDAMNEGMIKMLQEYAKEIKITFLTTPKHVKL